MSAWPMRVVRITSVVHAARFRPGDRQRVQLACGRWWWLRDIEEVDLDVSCEACDKKVRADEKETP